VSVSFCSRDSYVGGEHWLLEGACHISIPKSRKCPGLQKGSQAQASTLCNHSFVFVVIAWAFAAGLLIVRIGRKAYVVSSSTTSYHSEVISISVCTAKSSTVQYESARGKPTCKTSYVCHRKRKIKKMHKKYFGYRESNPALPGALKAPTNSKL
jgi:hypothetical protein